VMRKRIVAVAPKPVAVRTSAGFSDQHRIV
jgi:hypothetical protein